ncbi:hypothetical protein ACFLY5_00510 [Patescibacteria group bacterium]
MNKEKEEGVQGYGEGGFDYTPPTIETPAKYNKSSSAMVRLVFKLSGGLVKNEAQASIVMLGFAVVIIIISLFVLFGGSGRPSPTPADQMIEIAGPEGELLN